MAAILLAALLLAGAAIWAARTTTSARSASDYQQHCRPQLYSYGSVFFQCFRPSQRVRAEAALPFTALDRRVHVHSTTGLTLTQEIVVRRVPFSHSGRLPTSLPAIGIYYVFGHVPDVAPPPAHDRSTGRRLYLTVYEEPATPEGRWERFKGPTMLKINLPDKDVKLTISTDGPKNVLRRLGSDFARA